MNSLKAMYGCGLNFFIKLAYNSLFLYKFAKIMVYFELNKYEYIKKQTTNNNQPNEKKQQGCVKSQTKRAESPKST